MSTLSGISDGHFMLLQKLRALSRLQDYTRGTVDDHGTVFTVTSQVGSCNKMITCNTDRRKGFRVQSSFSLISSSGAGKIVCMSW